MDSIHYFQEVLDVLDWVFGFRPMEFARTLDQPNVTRMQVSICVFIREYNGAGKTTRCGSRVVLKAFGYVAFRGFGILVRLGTGGRDVVILLFFKEGLIQVDGDVDRFRSLGALFHLTHASFRIVERLDKLF